MGNEATAAAASNDRIVWLKTADTGKRPSLNEIVKEAKAYFAGKSSPDEQLDEIASYVTGKGNPTIGKLLGSLTEEQRKVYFEQVVPEVVEEHCDPKNWRNGSPVRPSIMQIIERAKRKFREKGWRTATLDRIAAYVEAKGNRAIGASLGSMSNESRTGYFSTVTEVFAARCGYEKRFIPTISSASPSSAKAGQKGVAISLAGSAFPEDAIVYFLDADGNVDPSIKTGSVVVANDGKSLSFKADLDGKAVVGLRSIRVRSGKHEQLTSAPLAGAFNVTAATVDGSLIPKIDTAKPAEQVLSAWQRTGQYLNETLKLHLNLRGGLAQHALMKKNDVPNFSFDLSLGSEDKPMTLLGRNNPVLAGTQQVELLGNVGGYFNQAFHIGEDDTRIGGAGGQLRLRINTIENGGLFYDFYGGANYSVTGFESPNKFKFSGDSTTLTGGMSVNTNFGTSILQGHIFGEYNYAFFNWNDKTFPIPFSGTKSYLRLGGQMGIDLNSPKYPGAPNITLRGAMLAGGRIEVPEVSGILQGSSFDRLGGGEGEMRLAWPGLSASPALAFGLQHLYQEGFKPMDRYYTSFSASYDPAGSARFNFSFTQNPDLYYGGNKTVGSVTLTPSARVFSRADAFSVTPVLYQRDGDFAFGAYLGVDVMKLMFGQPAGGQGAPKKQTASTPAAPAPADIKITVSTGRKEERKEESKREDKRPVVEQPKPKVSSAPIAIKIGEEKKEERKEENKQPVQQPVVETPGRIAAKAPTKKTAEKPAKKEQEAKVPQNDAPPAIKAPQHSDFPEVGIIGRDLIRSLRPRIMNRYEYDGKKLVVKDITYRIDRENNTVTIFSRFNSEDDTSKSGGIRVNQTYQLNGKTEEEIEKALDSVKLNVSLRKIAN